VFNHLLIPRINIQKLAKKCLQKLLLPLQGPTFCTKTVMYNNVRIFAELDRKIETAVGVSFGLSRNTIKSPICICTLILWKFSFHCEKSSFIMSSNW